MSESKTTSPPKWRGKVIELNQNAGNCQQNSTNTNGGKMKIVPGYTKKIYFAICPSCEEALNDLHESDFRKTKKDDAKLHCENPECEEVFAAVHPDFLTDYLEDMHD